MLVHLTAGHLMPLAQDVADANDNMIEREAMLVYTGDFESMDGPVTVTDEHLTNLSSNHNSWLSKFTRLATGDLPAKAYPPIQLDHSPSAKDTVGRLVGDLTIRDYEDDGVVKKALFGKMRILGKENVEKVKDGRWTHLSIGADLETGKLNELTITPFPAAPNAAMLSRLGADWKNKGDVWTADRYDFHAEIEYNQNAKEFLYFIADDDDNTVEKGSEKSLKAAQTQVDRLLEYLSRNYKMSAKLAGRWITKSIGGEKHSEFVTGVWTAKSHPGGDWELYKNGRLIANGEENTQSKAEDKVMAVLENEMRNGGQNMSKDKTNMSLFANMTDAEVKAKYAEVEGKLAASQKANGDDHPDTKALKAECDALHSDMLERGMLTQVAMSSEGDGKMDKEKLKKHLMETEKMSAEDAEKKLAGMPEEEQKKLASAIDEKEKMAAAPQDEAEKEKTAKMASARTGLVKLAKDLKAANESIRLAAVKSKLHSRLSALKADARITPAEIKKIDLNKLATSSQATIDAVFESYEKREPLVLTGVYGSAKSMNVAEMAKKLQAKKLEETTLSNMSFTKKALANSRKLGGAKLAADEPNEVAEKGSHMEPDGDETDMSDAIGKHFDEMMKFVSEGKHEDAKSYLKGVFKRYGSKGMESKADVPYDKEEALTGVESQVEKMHTIQSDMLKLISDLGIDAE